jgi:hypothetical protein
MGKRKPITHYREGSDVLYGSNAKEAHGKRGRPIPGSSLRVSKASKFMGNIITAENRREYESRYADGFRETYLRDVVKKRSVIEAQEGKDDEVIQQEVFEFNEKQISEEELTALSKRAARYSTNKEAKHYKAWKKGAKSYMFKGSSFPVITERFLKDNKSITEILEVDEGVE